MGRFDGVGRGRIGACDAIFVWPTETPASAAMVKAQASIEEILMRRMGPVLS
jgi:hypothetical protein